MRRGGWRTNRKTGGRFYSYGYGYNKQYLPKLGRDVIQGLPRQPKNTLRAPQRNLKTSTILSIFDQAPLISELHAAYTVADFLWNQRELISNLSDIYDKKGPEGLASAIGTDMVKDCLTDVQTDIFWSQIGKVVPAPFQPEAKACFSKVVEKITDAEVEFISNFIATQRG